MEPKLKQLTLTADVVSNRDIFVIGDVHGCYDEMLELLALASSEVPNMLPVFVGDLVNKGPKSIEVLRKIRTMDAFVVMGNHDMAVIKNYINYKDHPDETLRDKFKWIVDMTDEDLCYLQNLPHLIKIPSCNAIIVHAGIQIGVPLDEQSPRELTHVRNVVLDKESKLPVTKELVDEGVPWASLWTGPEHVYFGHDAVRRLQKYPLATGLDTGCVYGGKLTGCFINTGNKKILEVSAEEMYEIPGSKKKNT